MKKRLSEREVRIAKVEQLRAIGITPYKQHRDKSHALGDVDTITDVNSLRDVESVMTGPRQDFSLAGRLLLKRVSGKLAFAQLLDQGATLQLMFEHQLSSLMVEESFDADAASQLQGESQKRFDYWFVDKMLDVGDWIGVKGELFVTHKGELTLFVDSFQLLSKAVRPLGDKYHGIGDDQESAYRQRYLDMIFNKDVFERMKFRSDFIRTLREFYWSEGFLEIDCPVLIPAASGAAAKPFSTYHNDFGMDFFLRICNETELKKATIGGFEKVFTLGTNFRNEGSDPSHLQEFMMLEHQNVYKSFYEDMTFTERMFDHLFDILELDRVFDVEDKMGAMREVDFTTPWPRIDYVQGVNHASGLDITSYGIDDADRLRSDIQAQGIQFEGMDQMGTMTLIDYLYKKVLRPTITGPVFVYNYPSIIAPLARVSNEDDAKCEKWQVVVNGWEIINSYGELVDPMRQRENFAEQAKAEAGGDEEATSADMEFVSAMEYGMPIQAGFGMGIERILAMITQQRNLRDVVMFPLMKPLHGVADSDTATTQKETSGDSESIESHESEVASIADVSGRTYTSFPTRESIDALADRYLTDTLGHCRQVAKVMAYFAQKLGQNVDQWYAYGLLHDVDRDVIGKDAEQHLGEQFERIVAELFENDSDKKIFLDDIRSHYDVWGVPVDSVVRKYLSSIDELSGLIYAYSLMRPNGYDGMSWKSLNKKIKDNKFAAGVDREHVRYCEKYLDIPLSEFALEVAAAMGREE